MHITVYVQGIRDPTIASTYGDSAPNLVAELQTFLDATNELTAPHGAGGDCPERQLDALLETLKVRNAKGQEVMIPGSHIVMLTDAPSHAPWNATDVINAANMRNVCISFFLSISGGCIDSDGEMMYERIANETGGTVTREISQNGFLQFDINHEYAQCAKFHGIPLLGARRKRQTPVLPSYDTYDTEKRCHSFTTSLLTATLKVTAYTIQPAMTVTKPTGESVSVPSLYRSSGPVFAESSPPHGEWTVCVNTGNLTMTLEKNDVMDNILKYLRPVLNSTQFLTISNPPAACEV